MDRKAELEKKKAKLLAMREEKRRKDEERRIKGDVDSLGGSGAVGTPSGDLRLETEEMLKTLGISETPSPAGSLATPTMPGQTPDGSISPKLGASPKRQRRLQYSRLAQTVITQQDRVIYCKETQTTSTQPDRDNRSWDYYVLTYDETNREDEIDASRALAELQKMPHVGLVPSNIEEANKEKKEKEIIKVRELSEEEKVNLMMSEDFIRFFDKTTRIMERAISEPVQIFTDYSGADREEEVGQEKARQLLKLNREFYDERWSRHRVVTSLDWSTNFPELLLAAYNVNEEAPHEPDGVCMIWNLKYRRTSPEYMFRCQSAIMSATLAKFHPNLIVAGTYSGQIVLWDSRSNKRTPVQRTPLSATAHTHPVHAVTVAGTPNAHNLISLSSDGKLCSWTLDMLSQPRETIELQWTKQARPVTATSLSFFANDVNNFAVGAEEGCAYTGVRHGSKAGINEVFESHFGPVTSVDTHVSPGPIDFSHLFLTASFDWTVKLWSSRDSKPIHSFEDSSDYIYDVAWSPIHPAIFASVDGTGRLDLWNINEDPEVPRARLTMGGLAALNRCRWHSSGLHIATGDDQGKVSICDVNEQYASPRADEWSDMAHALADLRNVYGDIREEADWPTR